VVEPERRSEQRKRADQTRQSKKKPGREYLRAAQRRHRILESARDVFVRVGPSGTRTRELANAAGINEATMFRHFANKEEIFVAAVIEPLQAAMKHARERSVAFTNARPGKARAAVGRAAARGILASAKEFYPLLAVGLFGEREAGRKLYCQHVYPLLRQRGEDIQAVLREGVNGEFLSIVIFGIALALSADRAFRGVPFDVDDLADQMSDLLRNGTVPKRVKTKTAISTK
jgi:TetR/AcrR family transcriptional regulator